MGSDDSPQRHVGTSSTPRSASLPEASYLCSIIGGDGYYGTIFQHLWIRATTIRSGYTLTLNQSPIVREHAGCFIECICFLSVEMVAKSPHRKSRRSEGPIATPLETFRKGLDSEIMRNALAELAMRLIDAEDREEFCKMDGITTLGRSVESNGRKQDDSNLYERPASRPFSTPSGRAGHVRVLLDHLRSLWSQVRPEQGGLSP